jgi:uncharacterized protein (TIGR02118 family)
MSFPHHVKLYRLSPQGAGPVTDGLATSQWTPASTPSPIAASHLGPVFAAIQAWTFTTVEDAGAFRARHEEPDAEWFTTREHVVVNGAPLAPEDASYGVKMLIGMNRLDGLSIDSFQRYWLDEHSAFTQQAAGTSRYTIAVTDADEYAGQEPLFDGVAELWWRTVADYERYMASPVMAGLGDDTARFVTDTGPFWSAFAIDGERWGTAIAALSDSNDNSRSEHA